MISLEFNDEIIKKRLFNSEHCKILHISEDLELCKNPK